MADEKSKSNVIRPQQDKYIPDEKIDDWKKWRSSRTIRGEGTSLGAAAETALSTQKLPAVYEAMLKKMWLAKQNEEKPSDRIKKANPVMVSDYSEDALKKAGLGKWSLKKKEDGVDKKEKEKDPDFLTKLFQAAIPLLVIGGGLLGSLKQMFAGGPLQGISNILSKVFVVLGDALIKKIPSMGFLTNIFGKGGFVRNMLSKIFGKGSFVTKIFGKGGAKLGLGLFKGIGKAFLKRLPIIGSLISLGSAWKRLQDGDVLGGLIDIGAAVAYMFPGVGTGIGIALDVLNATMDISEARSDGTGFGGAVVKMKEWVSNNARNLPLIGGIIRMGEGLGYISMGGKDNILLGLKTLASAGFAQFGLGGVFDWLFGSTEVDSTDDQKTNKVGNVLKFITGYIRDVLWEKITASINRAKKWVEEKTGELGAMAIGAMEDIGLLPKGGAKAKAMEESTKQLAFNTLKNPNATDAQKTQAIHALEKAKINNLKNANGRRGNAEVVRENKEITEAIKEQTEAIKEQSQFMKETQSTGNTTVANQNNTTNSQSTFVHSSTGVTKQRNNRRYRPQKLGYA